MVFDKNDIACIDFGIGASRNIWNNEFFYLDAIRYNLKIFYIHKNLLKGALLWGNISNAGVYGDFIVNRRNISPYIDYLDSLDIAKREDILETI